MSLKVLLLVVSLVSQCWTSPQRRNWTPQAILYLKGAQGHGSALERSGREDALHSVSDEPRSAAASFLLLELLQEAAEEGGGRGQELKLNSL